MESQQKTSIFKPKELGDTIFCKTSQN